MRRATLPVASFPLRSAVDPTRRRQQTGHAPASGPRRGSSHIIVPSIMAAGVALALGALALLIPGSAAAANTVCTTTSSTVTCSGYQNDGVLSGRDFNNTNISTLHVNSLLANITPAQGNAGVNVSNGSGTAYYYFDVSLADKRILTSGAGAHGIVITSQGSNGGGGSSCSDPTGITCQAGGTGKTGQVARPPSISFQGTIVATATGSTSGPVTGIRAVGISGNGGNGGNSVCCNGGRGGAGGAGPAIWLSASVYSSNSLQITGDNSPGVFLLSQAGAGGNGGSSTEFGSGGGGGSGGIGGPVNYSMTSAILTNGVTAPGISIASVGGNGGKGGGGSWVSGGGSGGTAANGGIVTVNAAGSVQTQGPESYGIIAQSVGGRAGAGGSTTALVSFAATGGSGGGGGTVNITNQSALTTKGEQSTAIVAQSIGGAGGHGGSGFGAFYAQGSAGSLGGAGGAVNVTNSGAIDTYGNDAHGIQAQSIGGTGGDGGSVGGIVALGGGASVTSNGGSVYIQHSGGAIRTGLGPASKAGPDPTCGTGCSHGIFAQSIGGGGGNGGSAGGWFTVGGKGGGGGSGAPAGVQVDGSTISTALIDSSAVFIQSIGGGGGHGGNGVSVGAGGAVAIGGGGGSGGAGQLANAQLRNGTTLTTVGDRSHGMLVQSIGGGGGTGGFAVSVAVSAYAAAGVSVGGTGGPGGSAYGAFAATCVDGKDCNTKLNSITTAGHDATGITAQSVGGGGGNGGFAISVAAGGSIGSFAFATGGNGGIGGNGFDANVLSDAQITTAGLRSHGILAQSVGGGGGNGGFAIAGAVNLEGPGIAVAVGGQGKSGGSGNIVTVTTNGGLITTGGGQANAILAQSIGGGGGNGGLSIAGTISGQTGGLGVSVGGNGGNGGSAAKVTVSSGANIVTTGDKAAGLVAQSIGGGGGNGGMSLSGAISGSNAKTMTFSLGGAAATGGSGGAVAVTNARNITTGNKNDPGNVDDPIDNAHGILAQSIGGGGGNGGFAGALTLGLQGESTTVNVALAIGGTGGSAGTGGAVTVSNTGAPEITTYSSQSHGVFAQSVGGSGGAGGSGFAGTIEALASASSSTYNVSFAVGGKGGAGSTGGTSAITNTGGVSTWGSNSHGLFASSVGGSGGSGGSATTLALNCKQVNCKSDKKDDPPTGSNYNLQVGIGGNGGGGSHGGNVTLTNYGGVHTRGDGAMALYAYSIGGSGGDGGDASMKSIEDTKDRVKFYKNIQIEVGGKGGSSSNGGAVTIIHQNAPITTEGGNAPAVFAQSVGGGGGRGGTGASGFTGKVAVGGGGGAAGDGGNVNVSIAGGSIATLSTSDPSSTDPDLDASFGIFAQSVGGGGGYGGNPEMGDAKVVHIGTGLAFGAAGGSAGNGGTVIVTPSTSITTHADNAIGIFAQSVGGGGGVAGDAGINPTFSTFIGSNGNTGNGGTVNVGYNGTLTTAGDGAHGIFAQSAGGKTTGSSSAAAVSVAVTGTVEATGTDADGIKAQSIGMTSTGAAIGAVITVTVNANSVVQGGRAVDSQTAGVRFLDGGANILNNSGTITALAGGTGVVHSGVGSLAVFNSGSILTSAASLGTAIRTGDGNDLIRNRGLIDGSVVLGAGRNHFRNQKRGTFRPGRLVEVGHGNQLVNDGTLVIGGVDLAGETRRHRLDGDFVQTKKGRTILVLQHLLDHSEPILHVTGMVDMAGRLAADIRNPELFETGSGTLTVIRAEGGISEATERRLEVETSPVAEVEVAFAEGEARLSYTIDFASEPVLAALNANQSEVARALESLRGIDPAASTLMSVAAAEDLPSFAQAVGRLSPEPYAANQVGTLFSALRFAHGLLDCSAAGGGEATVTETGCGWLAVQGNRFERDSTDDDSRYTDDRWGITGGFERRLAGGWSLGGSLGYERPDMASGGFSNTDGHQVQAGIAARLEQGAWLLGAGLTAGWAWLDVDRDTGADGIAEADQDLGFVSGRLRGGHRFISGGLRLEPRVDLAATVIRMDDLSEDGAGAASLDVDSQTETFFTVQPAFEVGYAVAVGDGWRLEPQASIGLTQFLTGNEPNVQARFAATPGAGGIGASSSLDSTYLDLAVGLEIARGERLSLRAGGFAMLGDNTENYGGTLSIAYRF
jgi:hypothetical protein